MSGRVPKKKNDSRQVRPTRTEKSREIVREQDRCQGYRIPCAVMYKLQGPVKLKKRKTQEELLRVSKKADGKLKQRAIIKGLSEVAMGSAFPGTPTTRGAKPKATQPTPGKEEKTGRWKQKNVNSDFVLR